MTVRAHTPILHSTAVDAIARRLMVTREAFGLSQKEFSEAASIALNTYNQWERGHGRPQLDHAFLLCNTYSITLDWIYRGELSGLSFDIMKKLKPFLPEGHI